MTADPDIQLSNATKTLADWCEDRAGQLEQDAKQQMKAIITLLIAGVILLIITPKLLSWVDGMLGDLPDQQIEEAEQALAKIEDNRDTFDKQKKESEAQLAERMAQQKAAAEKRDKAKQTFDTLFDDNRHSIWRGATPGRGIIINDIQRNNRNEWVAVGAEVLKGSIQTLILTSPDGQNWAPAPAQPQRGPDRINGALLALSPTPNGGWLAAGWEDAEEPDQTLILASPDGQNWAPTSAQPQRGPDRINGGLLALSPTPNGGWLAAGWEDVEGPEQTLILTSPDGQNWAPAPAQPQRGADRISGRLRALSPAPNGGWLAAGWEDAEGPHQTLILTSPDGQNWAPAPGQPQRGADRISGRLRALSPAPNGGWLAAGSEDAEGSGQTLILTSPDGQNWAPSPAQPQRGADRISGELIALSPTPNGGWLAEGWDNENGPLLVKITPDFKTSSLTLDSPGSATAIIATETTIIIGGDFGLLIAAPEARAEVIAALKAGEDTDYITPVGAREAAHALRLAEEELTSIDGIVQRQQDLLAELTSLTKDMNEAHGGMKLSRERLETAIRDNDNVRQLGRTATRLGVVALLVFLVQIFVNRYRYLQRLADFYHARAQVFSLAVASGPKAVKTMLKGMTVADLTATLSSENVGFGKPPEAPTAQLSALLQAAAKR